MMEVLGSRAEKVLGVDEKKPDADLHSFDHIDWDHVDLVMTSPVSIRGPRSFSKRNVVAFR